METGGTATLRYHSTGLACEVFLPPASVLPYSTEETRGPPAEPNGVHLDPGAAGQPYRILVAEDAFLLVTLLQDLFETLGWEMIGPATRLVDALHLARNESFDAALLDVNLDGTTSWEVAIALKERGIPFVFGTGYHVSAILPENLAGSPIVGKPYQLSELQHVIQRVIDASASTGRPGAADRNA
jgi:CheY-like chemotaxis protein